MHMGRNKRTIAHVNQVQSARKRSSPLRLRSQPQRPHGKSWNCEPAGCVIFLLCSAVLKPSEIVGKDFLKFLDLLDDLLKVILGCPPKLVNGYYMDYNLHINEYIVGITH